MEVVPFRETVIRRFFEETEEVLTTQEKQVGGCWGWRSASYRPEHTWTLDVSTEPSNPVNPPSAYKREHGEFGQAGLLSQPITEYL